MGFELILPFLAPIASLIQDQTISEIMVNGGTQRIYIERSGRLEHVPNVTLDAKSLRVAIQNIARLLGDDFSEEQPLLDARLPDGSRVAAVLPPCSVNGITLTIRKFGSRFFSANELVDLGTLPQDVLTAIATAIGNRENVLISGGTGSGKTTLLNALAAFVPDDERVIVIEDTSELRLDKPNIVRFEARREQPPYPAVAIRDLVRATLRHRPDRIILGEVRGGEAFDLMMALNTGHSGSLTTIHANTAAQALTRLANCVLMSGVELPYPAIRASLADSIHHVVHVTRDRRDGRRIVSELVRVGHYHPETDTFTLHRIYGVS
jgi:pilus assembly protein CpaF